MSTSQTEQTSRVYRIGNMDCANCAREVEQGVIRLDGVNAARVDFSTGKLLVEGDVSFDVLRERVEALGKTIVNPEDDVSVSVATRKGLIGFWDYLLSRHETRLALIGGLLIIVATVLSVVLLGGIDLDDAQGLPALLVNGLYTVALAVAAYPIARSGLNTLRINREFSINLLMAIAGVGAIIIGEYLEAATVIFLFAIGEALEGYVAERARDSLRSLLELKPNEAIVLRGDSEVVLPVAEVQVGDHVLVRAGERIPLDGLVCEGTSAVDQAPITGESIPVQKVAGDEVYAGTVNGNGTLQIEVTSLSEDTTLSRIIRLVEEAQSARAPSQRLIDRFAHYYTPAIVVIALLVAVVPPVFFNASFYSTADTQGWLYRALTMLVIACPCALVISTPVTVISAITAAARRGVLIKGGAHLEALGTIRAVAFDKTGTLTQGSPEVIQVHSVDCAEPSSACPDCDDVLALAAAVERRSTHPLAQAVVRAADRAGVTDRYAAAAAVETLSGMGLHGDVDTRHITVGSHSLFDARFPHDASLCRAVIGTETAGQTTIMLAADEQVLGYISVADKVRSSSRDVLSDLHAMGLQTIMLTGDNPTVAAAVAADVGVHEVRAQLLPDQKVDAVRELMSQYGPSVMVGDGINDTPALATATVGVAMGGAGSAQAMETADVVLMADDITQLPVAIRLARFARRLIAENIVLSLGLKIVFLLLAAAGGASLWAAVFADVGMSLIVTLNGMRPLRMRN
ncbi:MAG: heavy metal translocating P-type ATPase [Anaerolineae bacterium]